LYRNVYNLNEPIEMFLIYNYKQLSEITLDIETVSSYFVTEYLNLNK